MASAEARAKLRGCLPEMPYGPGHGPFEVYGCQQQGNPRIRPKELSYLGLPLVFCGFRSEHEIGCERLSLPKTISARSDGEVRLAQH